MSGETEQKIHTLRKGNLTDQLVDILTKDEGNEVHVELNQRETVWISALVGYLHRRGFRGSVVHYEKGGKNYLKLVK